MDEIKEKTPEEQLKDALFYLQWGIDYWGKAFAMLPQQVKGEVENSTEYGYKQLAATITGSLKDIKQFEETLSKEKQNLFDKLDNLWKEVSLKHQEIKDKIEKLEKVEVKIDTYGIERVIELLEKLQHYDTKTWTKFEKLCAKLK